MNNKNKAAGFHRLSLLRYFLKGSTPYFFCSMLFAAAVSLVDMVGPRIISFTVDSVIGDKAPQLPGLLSAALVKCGGIGMLRRNPWIVALLVGLAALLGAVFRFLFRYVNTAAAEKFVKSMRDKLYRKIQHVSYAWHGENAAGDIIQRCTSDVETIKVFVSEQLTSLIRVIVLIIFAVTFMAGIHPGMTIAVSLFIPVIVGYSFMFYTRIGNTFQLADEEEGRLSAIAQENLTGVRVVRAFGRERDEKERFEKQNSKYTLIWIRLMRILTMFWVTGDLITGLQYLLVNVMGAVFCIRGSITAGQFIAFVSYNAMLTWPVRSLGRVISEMSKAGISLDRLIYIMNEPEETDGEEDTALFKNGEIVFDHVSFAYPGTEKEVLSDVSFSVSPGTTLGILGKTGSGKSTLMYLLERLYDLPPGCGAISVGGKNLAQIRRSSVRGNIGMVLQEPMLFSRTLQDNITIAREDPDEDALSDAVKVADLTETVERFPSGFRTKVGERGVTLSGGQKQRAAMAQMLIRNCPVMIFDDSLSAVDTQTDERIRAALKERTAGATVFLIAHRVSTLMHADRILVMDEGKIAEQGTHEELMKAGGLYRQIYDLQSGVQEPFAVRGEPS